MSFRFFRRMRIAPGLSLNFSKSGPSLSAGPRGAKFTIGAHGTRRTVGLPGTGLYYTKHQSWGAGSEGTGGRSSSSASAPPPPHVSPEDRLTLGFFDRLFAPKREENFVDGMREVVRGDEEKACKLLSKDAHLPDAAFIGAMLACRHERFDQAARWLNEAWRERKQLGRYFKKYKIDPAISLPITETMTAHIDANDRGILLALAEVYQHEGQTEAAAAKLKQLHHRLPDDVVVKLSLMELIVEERGDKPACKQAVHLSEGIENDSDIHAAILLFKGKALEKLGLHTAARDTLTKALRKKKDRSDELRNTIRYERALVYEAMGNDRRRRAEFEKLYAADPDFEDVADRLGV